MATYTFYWPEWACADARAAGIEGEGLPVFVGGHNADSDFSRFKVGPGDTVIAVSVIDGTLHLLASLIVTDKALAEPWLRAHPEHARFGRTRGGGQVLAGTPRAPLDFGRTVPPELLPAWRFDSGKDGRPIKFIEGGKIKRPLSLQGVYRLTEATATAVGALLEARPRPQAARDDRVTTLMEQLLVDPWSEDTASVLADAWLERGDVRGELLALELALHRAAPAEQTALWKRLDALTRKRGVSAALKQPGGFPFRRVGCCRDHVVWQVRARLSKPLAFEGAERRLAGWCAIERVSLDRPRRELAPAEARALDPRADLHLELRLLHPETGLDLPFQTKRFLSQPSEMFLGREPFFSLRCAVPVARDGPLLRAWLRRAREALPGGARRDEELALVRFDGHVPERAALDP